MLNETALLERSNRFLEEVWNRGDVAVVDELMSPDLVDHAADPSGPGGPDGVKTFVTAIRAGLPDLAYDVAHEAARGDVVLQHIVVTGTHAGPLFGLPGSGNSVRFELADIFRFGEDGRIAEHWSVMDSGALMQQLGAIAPVGVGR